ncbi:MAG: nitronate monooxygenase [Alcanivorax sp.]|nr:nitronate monooxygenase [Alcanivorax sp.]
MTHQLLFASQLPLIQAPMAGVQDWRLAAAVSNAGGLGSLPAGMLDANGLHQQLTALSQATTQPYNVNFFCHTSPASNPSAMQTWADTLAPYFQELGEPVPTPPATPSRQPFDAASAEVLEAFRPAVVSFHYGLPSRALLNHIKGWGGTVLSSATTVDEARWLAANGADGIIAQGWEAGGHRGHFLSDDLSLQQGTFSLLPQIVEAVSLPVIAAGGIASPQAARAALTLGASAVQAGTCYLLCPQATTKPIHRQWLQSERGRHTAVTNVFSGRPARGMVNRLIRELGPISVQAPAFPLAGNLTNPLRTLAENHGSGEFSPLWAGENVTGCRDMDAGALTLWLMGQDSQH